MSTKEIRLILRDTIGSLRFRRYEHDRHGVIETLTKDSVVYVRPVFGFLKPDDPQPAEVANFQAQKPKQKRAGGLGDMWKRLRAERLSAAKGASKREAGGGS